MKNNISNTITPSMELGIKITPRVPDFKFDKNSIPKLWFSGDTGITTAWNALSIVTGVGEIRFVKTGQWLIDRINNEEFYVSRRIKTEKGIEFVVIPNGFVEKQIK